MKKRVITVLILITVMLALTSCLTTKTVYDSYEVEPAVSMQDSENYEAVGTMKKKFSVNYTLFTQTQKPSDQELAQTVQKATVSKYGKNAVAADLVFTKERKDTMDLASPILNSSSLDSTTYAITVEWTVYKPI